jgi:hypothetical protein
MAPLLFGRHRLFFVGPNPIFETALICRILETANEPLGAE